MSILSSAGYLGAAKQASKGTAVAPTKFFQYIDESLTPEQESIRSGEGGQDRYEVTPIKTTHNSDGSFTAYARPDMAGFLYTMLLGNDTISGVGDPYTHTIIKGTTPLWLSMERSIDTGTTLIERVQDCKIEAITIEAESNQPPLMTVEYMGKTVAIQSSAATTAYESDPAFRFFDGTFTLDSGAITNINKFMVKITNNFDKFYGTDYTFTDLIEKMLQVDLEFTLKFDNATHYKKVYYGASTAPVNTIATGDFTVDMNFGTTNRQLKIEIPEVQHTASPVTLAGEPAPIFMDCTGYGTKASGSELVTVTVQNATSTAYDA